MAYRIDVERRVRKALLRLPRPVQARIAVTIDALAEEPRPAGCQPVKAAPKGTYRIRVGDYRVIYTVLDDEQLIIVGRVAKRGEHTYKGLR